MPYVKNLTVIADANSNVSLPFPWKKIPVDLNRGAGGLFIYLFKSMGNGSPPLGAAVTGVTILEGQNPAVPPGYAWDDTDLNKSVGGAFLYLAWTYATNLSPLLDVHVVSGATRNDALANIPSGWDFVDKDLNKGAGGQFIYLIYKRV